MTACSSAPSPSQALLTTQLLQRMTNPEMEEKLREAACFGDLEGVKELIARSGMDSLTLENTICQGGQHKLSEL